MCDYPEVTAVKFADIEHNCSNIKRGGKGGGSMRDKYLLAQSFISITCLGVLPYLRSDLGQFKKYRTRIA